MIILVFFGACDLLISLVTLERNILIKF